MRLFKYVLVVGFIVFGFAYVKANKTKNFQFKTPANFIVEANYFPAYYPTTYTHTGPEKITILVPAEIKSKLGAPKTNNGQLKPEFLKGKMAFNEQFGIEGWKMDSFKFSNTPYGERLELSGSYTSFIGVKTEFVEHHYFGKSAVQSIHLFYPAAAQGKAVEQAKASLQTFNPNIN